MRLYQYHGTISIYGPAQNNGCTEITLYNPDDDRVPPTRLDVAGELDAYIHELGWTDDEERYLRSTYYYDADLRLVAIEIPSDGEYAPAKALISRYVPGEGYKLDVFGPREHITTDRPHAMSREDFHAYVIARYEAQNQ